MKLHIISLGCPKNLVDSESVAGIITAGGHELCGEPAEAEAIVINTCAFIESAVKESENAIRAAARYGKKLFVCGCLPQIKGESLKEKFPQVSAFIGTGEFHRITDIINSDKLNSDRHHLLKSSSRAAVAPSVWRVGKPEFIQNSGTPRKVSTTGYAYLKISEGCDNNCSYCLIPQIRGIYRSRPVGDIIKEAEKLAGSGVKEIILIGQDTTAHPKLPDILKKLDAIKDLEWIRLLYTHPGHFSDAVINAIASSKKICRYIDLPIQHTRDEILKTMGRPPAKKTFELIDELRKKIPGAAIRSVVMVGFPGETPQIFSKMLKDLERIRFDWLGCFEYSPQAGTKAVSARFTGAAPGASVEITAKEKKARYNKVMAMQQKITGEINLGRIGKTFKVLADSNNSGHAGFQCPEIDGRFILKNATAGKFISVTSSKVVKAYDLQ